MKRIPILIALLAVYASEAAAQAGLPRVEFRTRGLVRAHDNLYQVAVDSLARTVLAWGLNERITLRRPGSGLSEVYLEVDHTQYGTVELPSGAVQVRPFGRSLGGGGGLRLQKKRHSVWLRGAHWANRPALDVGDAVTTADILWIGADYVYYGSDWYFQMGGETTRVFRDSTDGNNAGIYEIGGTLRYRGVGPWLEPEVGGRAGWQRVGSPGWDDTRADVYAGLILSPGRALRTSVRYRLRLRHYPAAPPGSANFNRSDSGRQWTVSVWLMPASYLGFALRFHHLDMDSNHRHRTYSTRMLSLGVTLWNR